jgi:hypothetical protein
MTLSRSVENVIALFKCISMIDSNYDNNETHYIWIVLRALCYLYIVHNTSILIKIILNYNNLIKYLIELKT